MSAFTLCMSLIIEYRWPTVEIWKHVNKVSLLQSLKCTVLFWSGLCCFEEDCGLFWSGLCCYDVSCLGFNHLSSLLTSVLEGLFKFHVVDSFCNRGEHMLIQYSQAGKDGSVRGNQSVLHGWNELCNVNNSWLTWQCEGVPWVLEVQLSWLLP